MNFIGNDKIRKRLEALVKHDHLPQAMIFTGPEQVGKFTLARQAALMALGAASSSGAEHPDLLVVAPEQEAAKGRVKEKDIPVAAMREVRRALTLSPYAGTKKIVIINDAHRLTTAAQNALLKTLEEPERYGHLVLVAHRAHSLLATVRSRCQFMRFGLVPEEAIAAALRGGSERDVSACLAFAYGRPGRVAACLSSEEVLHFYEDTAGRIADLDAWPLAERFSYAEMLSRDGVKARSAVALWVEILRKRLLAAPHSRISRRRVERALGTLEELYRAGANTRVAMEQLMLSL